MSTGWVELHFNSYGAGILCSYIGVSAFT
jgi:hypothetical protein